MFAIILKDNGQLTMKNCKDPRKLSLLFLAIRVFHATGYALTMCLAPPSYDSSYDNDSSLRYDSSCDMIPLAI